MKYSAIGSLNKVRALTTKIRKTDYIYSVFIVSFFSLFLLLSACEEGPLTPENSVPVAKAGSNKVVDAGAFVTLDGSASVDVDGDNLTFAWAFTSTPEGSAVALSGVNTATPSFTPDKVGIYELELIVSDGNDSDKDQVEVKARVPFKDWEQGFESGTDGWITNETSGAAGWCGSIEQQGSGAVSPSAGEGYAVITHSACNDYWSGHGFPNGSGPYSAGAGYSIAWPESGYVMQLDIYLDPSWSADFAGSVFTYSVNIRLLDKEYPNNFRYFLVPVKVKEGKLLVAGHEVSEAGWYTFRHTFSSAGGKLAIDFEIVRGGQTLFSEPVTETSFTGAATSSFAVSNVSNGYVWFVSIADGLGLAIDEHSVRRSE